MEKYTPPFEITNEMIVLIANIMEDLGNLSNINELEKLPRLRRVSRIKSIQSTLAIENNTLSLEQVGDVINGKKVIGPYEDILAVKDAFLAYKELDVIDPYDINELLKVHGVMMKDLLGDSGHFRSGNVGVVDNFGRVIHAAPPAHMVKELINSLFKWVKYSDVHMLIKSSVFHYEFEFIHPFIDGNGRAGRLWQTALLASWKPIFKYIPIESVIKDNQEEYYEAFRLSTLEGKSNKFILFMLKSIQSAVKDIVNSTHNHYNHLNIQVNKLMQVMEEYPQSANEIMTRLGMKSRISFRKNYLTPALEAGLIGMTKPDKPTSKNQMYFKIV